MSLDSRYHLSLANKAEIEALQQEKLHSQPLPALSEFLGKDIEINDEPHVASTPLAEELPQSSDSNASSDDEERAAAGGPPPPPLRITKDSGSIALEEGEADLLLRGVRGDSLPREVRHGIVYDACSPLWEEGHQPVFMERETDIEKAYMVALETIREVTESKLLRDYEDLLEFIRETFSGLKPGREKQLRERAYANKSSRPQLKFTCKVIRGSGLIAKDPNGKSDPYCRLALIKEKDRKRDIVSNKDILDWTDAGLVESDQINVTGIKPATLEPEWNEFIELPVKSFEEECLVLEVWDCDDDELETKESKGIKGLKGLGMFIAERTTKKGDDFMGRLFYPLRLIPPFGEEKAFPLFSHHERKQYGFITLQLHVKAIKDSVPIEVSISHHKLLARAMVDSCSKTDGEHTRVWDGELPIEAERILDYHAQLNKVSKLQRAYIKLALLLSYHKMYEVKLSTFYTQVERVRAAESLPQQGSPFFSPKPELVAFLFDGFENHVLSLIDGFMKDCIKESALQQFKHNLQIFHQLYTFSPFTERLPPGSKSLDEVVEKNTMIAVATWFFDQHVVLFDQRGQGASSDSFKKLMQLCASQLEKGLHGLHPLFEEVGVSFFSHFYAAFDKLISAEGMTRVYRTNDASLYPVYLFFRRIDKLYRNIDEAQVHGELHLVKSITWFESSNAVPDWIQIAMEKGMSFIRNAVAGDAPDPVTESVDNSTSAWHTEAFLLQMGSFWKNLDWPEQLMSFCYAVMMVNGIAECSQYYVSLLADNLKNGIDKLFDKEGHLLDTKELCMFFNNVDQIRRKLSRCTEDLDMGPNFYTWLDEKRKVGAKCKSLVERLLREADDRMSLLSNWMVIEIVNRMVPYIRHYLEAMVLADKNSNKHDKKVDNYECFAPLMDYLQTNLKLASNLHPSVAVRILNYIWQASVNSVDGCLAIVPRKRGKEHLYDRLFKTLKVLRDFFHADGEGIKHERLHTAQYEALYSKLEILRLPTDDLACRYLSELAQLQSKQQEETDGEDSTACAVHFSVAYYTERSAVEATILQALNLPSSDGSRIQVSLTPPWMFPKANSHRVKLQGNTFDEEIRLEASVQDMDTDGTTLLLSVYERDTNKSVGVCLVPCGQIPRLRSDSAHHAILNEGAPQRRVLRLPLIHPSSLSDSPVRDELESRVRLNDPKAKQIKKLLK